MCRYHQFWGFGLSAFGVGVLIGLWLDNGFFCGCFGVMLILLGVGIMKSRK